MSVVLLCPALLLGAFITQGAVSFQTSTTALDPTNGPVLYPTTPGEAATSNAAVPVGSRNTSASNLLNNSRMPLRSWLGGALWGKNNTVTDYFLPSATTFAAGRMWVSAPFPQNSVYTDNYLLSYLAPNEPTCSPPAYPTSAQAIDNQGITLNGLYPYLVANAGQWNGAVVSAGYQQPLAVVTPPLLFQDLQVMASTMPPPGDTGGVVGNLLFQPQTLYVDRMGDFDADLIYTFDYPNASAYAYNGGAATGDYIKMTVCQGSPFIWCESQNVPFIFLRNRIGSAPSPYFKGEVAPKSLPSDPTISYAIIYGNVDYPNNGAGSLNPVHTMDNFTTWVVYWKASAATATFVTSDSSTPGVTPATSTHTHHNNYLAVTTPASKFYFVIAQVPVQRNYPTTGTGTSPGTNYNLTAATAYAEALGAFAFNYVTNTAVSYVVENGNRVDTTFTLSTFNPLTSASGGSTIITLEPHQYQNMSLGTIPGTSNTLSWTLLNPGTSTPFAPSGVDGLQYWSVRGSLYALAGKSFTTMYPISNFLQCMPPPIYSNTFTSNTNPSQFSNIPVGEFIFWAADQHFLNDVSNNTSLPPAGKNWGKIAYAYIAKDSYGKGFDLEYEARELGVLQGMLQYLVNANGGAQVTSAPLHYSEDLLGAQRWIGTSMAPDWVNNRPGVNMANALQESTQQVQLMIKNLFPSIPVAGCVAPPPGSPNTIIPCPLLNFSFYDTNTGMLVNYPVATGLSSTPWPAPASLTNYMTPAMCSNEPGTCSTVPGAALGPNVTLATVNEGFGVGTNWNDHHYHWGYWISAAALAAIYDQAWAAVPTPSTWASGSDTGPAVDAMIMDLAYDPAIDASFFRNPAMTFAKMNFFDQWSGHGWADGVQACSTGAGTGHNENTQEGTQPFAAIAMWGLATDRKPITDLGLYLYATASVSFDFYMMDKNLNYKPGGGSSFVPNITTNSVPPYTSGQTFWDYTIHSSGSSGNPILFQSKQSYQTFFTTPPLGAEYIQSFPFAAWTLAISRNNVYMKNWLAAMETNQFKGLIDYYNMTPGTWDNSFSTNMLLIQGAVGDTNPAITAKVGDSSSWYTWFFDQVTAQDTGGPNFYPPWTGRWNGSVAPGSSPPNFTPTQLDVGLFPITEAIHFLAACNDYGALDWTITSLSSNAASGRYVFNAAFAKSNGATTFVAYNPFTTPQSVTFYQVGDLLGSTPMWTFNNIAPKQWAISPPVFPPRPTPNPNQNCGNGGNKEDVLYDINCLDTIYESILNKARGMTTNGIQTDDD